MIDYPNEKIKQIQRDVVNKIYAAYESEARLMDIQFFGTPNR